MQTNVYQFINEYGRMYPIQMYTYLNLKDINANKCIPIYYEYEQMYPIQM